MNQEEKKAIEDMNRFANGIDMSCVTARQMQIILNLIEKKENCINILDDELKERNKTINEKEIIIEKLQKENEELREDRDKFKKALGKRITYCNELEKDLFENCSKYVIPIQKIKDKIEEYKNMLKTCNKVKDIDRIKAINERILELQELLEGRR